MIKKILKHIRGVPAVFEGARHRLEDERGIAMPLVAVAMVALIAMTAVGVDTGRVATIATQAQNAADIAALAATRAVADDEDSTTRANETLGLNEINNMPAGSFLTSLEPGVFDENDVFTAGAEPTNAVRAVVTATVENIVLGAIGFPQATVSREAIATLSGMGSASPTLPIAIGDCNFDADCQEQDCMPYLGQIPNTSNNSAWTSYYGGNPNYSSVNPYIASPCGGGNTEALTVGDSISLGNGTVGPLLGQIQCLLNNGLDTFLVPIVPCPAGTTNQSKEVVGFAKVQIDQVRTVTPRGVWLHALWEGTTGTGGGGSFGFNVITLVK
jgi:hypothetical protein